MGCPWPLAPGPSVVTILQLLQQSHRYNTQIATTVTSLQQLNRYNTSTGTDLKSLQPLQHSNGYSTSTTTGLSTTLFTHSSNPLFLNPTARPSWGGGGVGPAADHKHVLEIYQRDRKKTSRGPVYYINETGRRHPGDWYTIYTRQEEDIMGNGILWQWPGRRHPGGRYTIAMARKKTSRGPVYYVSETGRRHPGDRYTI